MDKLLERLADSPWGLGVVVALLLFVVVLLTILVWMLTTAFRQGTALELWGIKIGPRPPRAAAGAEIPESVKIHTGAKRVAEPQSADPSEIKLKRIDHTEKITIGDDYNFQFESRFAKITVDALNPELLPTRLGEPQAHIQEVRVRFHTNFALEAGHRTKTIVDRTEFVMGELSSLWSFGVEPNNTYFLRISVERINPTASNVHVRFLYHVGPR